MAATLTRPTPRPTRVTVLEDQAFFCQLLGLIFTSAGYEVTLARTGQEMLDALERRVPDLVILDIDVPGIDGLQVLERLRRTHDRDRLPILMASARGESSYARRAKTLGANLFLKKPYSIGQIIGRVETLLAPARTANEMLI